MQIRTDTTGRRGRLALALAIMGMIAGCSNQEAPTEATAPASDAGAPQAGPATPPPPPSTEERTAQAEGAVEAAAESLAGQSPEALLENARTARGEQRLYAPSGDNAVEYYLALREKAPEDPAVSGALADLFPYVLIAAEQHIARNDLVEAERLYMLMQRMDAEAPALDRIGQSITRAQTAAERRAEEEARRVAQAEAQQAQQAQQQVQARQSEEAARLQEQLAEARRQAEAAQAEAARLEEERAAAVARARELAAQQASEQSASGGSAPAAAPTRRAPEIVSAPPPRYPPEALRAGTTGEVTVEFTVQPDGSVAQARVVSSRPSRIFDREALSAVRDWRFENTEEPITLRRTIAFQP
ncbi:energy transducer TonB [Coralloluteibacterium stylophorae]|uniref:Protein TonB n=1 Tax=Coralloluteibacterium stylophorae TaxID=1776034 RepID=A0A8J7VWD5_9GAMM|nr:energy transducer TonB [Coralloluteibacterium stylophorae]MBS7458966.1 energy transducer TonB [Coralloluteibacterium stylophorae]